MLCGTVGWQLKLVALCTRCFAVTLPSLRSHCLREQPCKTARCWVELVLQASNMLCDTAGWQLKLVALCTLCCVVTLPSLRSHCLYEQPCKTARCLVKVVLQASTMLCDTAGWQLKLVALCTLCFVVTLPSLKPLPLWTTMQNSKIFDWTSVATVKHVVWHCWLATKVGCIVHTVLCSHFAQLEAIASVNNHAKQQDVGLN